MMRRLQAGLGWLALVPTTAVAQQAAPTPTPAPAATSRPTASDDADEPDTTEVVVTGTRRQPGAVVGDIPPEQQLGPADIRSYGVSSVADLLNELSPQTRSDRGSGGAPVVLVNGRRISGFQEIRDLPTEAIARVDILPEEVALKYGYRADQRVVNFVLRRRFRATTVELEDRLATEGGTNTPQAELDLLNIKNDGRFNLHVSYQQQSALTEAERSIVEQPSYFTALGNVVPAASGGAIDPSYGAAIVAGVPAAAASGRQPLSAFTPGTATTTDQAPYRTLLPSTRALGVNLVLNHPLGKVNATINGRIDVADSIGEFGLPTVALTVPAVSPFSPFANPVVVDRIAPGEALQQQTASITTHLGATFNGNFSADWRWSLTGNYDRVDSQTSTGTSGDASAFQTRLNAGDPTANPFGALTPALIAPGNPNRATSLSNSGGVDALVNGPLFSLPAGKVTTAIRLGGSSLDLASSSFRAGAVQAGDVSRQVENGQVNVDIPLTSRSKGFLAAIGTLSANVNVAVDHLSDFGTLKTIGYGGNWAPFTGVRLLASITDQDDAPTPQQLGNPTITTPNVRVFDYLAGVTANVTTITGGNPNLVADSQHTAKVELELKPWQSKDLTFTANYVTAHIDNPIVSFPTATAAIERAFPGRFTRDASGILNRIDSRPINFARSERSELRYGINFSKSLKSKIQKELEAFRAGKGPNPFAGLQPPAFLREGRGGANGAPGGPPPGGGDGPPRGGPGGPGGGGFRGGGGGFGGRGGQGGGRLQFAVYHTIHFVDRIEVAPGGPSLDLLNGDAISTTGGQPRHEVEGQAGYVNNGLGARLSLNYATGTQVAGGVNGNTGTLNFGSLATLNLRLFADFGGRLDWVRKHPWLRGTRATIGISNLFDTRQRVTDQSGATPISYQPDYLDPLGRTIRLSIRKLFF